MVQATMTTSMGVIEMELDSDKAPKSVANFLSYARKGTYNGTIFHRVISNFMIQGGGFDKNMQRKPTVAPITNEADNGLRNVIGSVAMARTSAPHSASNQFFINTADNGFLNHSSKTSRGWGYAVFGRVTSGMDVVRKIEAVATGNQAGMQNVPLQAVTIEKVEIIEWKD
ncbi:MAG: peptidylprolyl isomerase [Mariprofundus sp.]